MAATPAIDVKQAPPVPENKIRVQAVHLGYFADTDMEMGDVFDIPIYPLNPKTGLPLCYSDSRKRVMSGRSGWMKPYGPAEEKKLLDLEAAFHKTGTISGPPTPKALVDLAASQAENALLKKQLAELHAKQSKQEEPEEPAGEAETGETKTDGEEAPAAPIAPKKSRRKAAAGAPQA